jgi:hypothetical protein
MKRNKRIRSFLLLMPLGLLTGCVGYNTALFTTKSNAGLDFDSKPPTAEINISRKEGVVEPSFEGGKTPPVMASFSSKIGSGGGLGRFFFGVDQTFAGGDAAVTMSKLYDSPFVPSEEQAQVIDFDSGLPLSKVPLSNTQVGKGWLGWKKRMFGLPEPGEVRPFFFGTDTQLGVKVGWNGLGGPYPDNLKIGFNRKEMAVAPVTLSPREVRKDGSVRANVVRIPSFLAAIDSQVRGTNDVEVGWLQYFATGEAASFLARQPGVRIAMARRADPLAVSDSIQVEIKQVRSAEIVKEEIQKRVGAIIAGIGKLPDAKAIELERTPPIAHDPDSDKAVALRDPTNQRATVGSVAREMLKMRISLNGERDEKWLAAWEAATKANE